jgi:catechol 2,3-dioxygenase-like lactoylglutathione lyase family enzyme
VSGRGNVALSVRHAGLVVRDLERSLAFYRDIIGLTVRVRMTESGEYIERVVGIPGAVLEWAKLECPEGSLVELIEYKKGMDPAGDPGNATPDRRGFSHVAFTVGDIEDLYRTLTGLGFHCNNPPEPSPDGLVKVMYCHDPDGIIVELVEELKK